MQKLSPVQKIALSQIQSDARFVCTLTALRNKLDSNYILISLPYESLYGSLHLWYNYFISTSSQIHSRLARFRRAALCR